MTRAKVEGIEPILSVRDLAASVQYYVQALGFTQTSWAYPTFTAVKRDGCQIFLCEGEQGRPGTWIWIGVDDADVLYEEYRRSGANVRHAPRNYPWALEFHVEDPDGHILRFGSEVIAERAFDEWKE
jgi:predicted enzyme related to lactoylglutathione lyase